MSRQADNAEVDLNWETFEKMWPELSAKHPGEYFAFCEGEYIGHHPDSHVLALDVVQRHPKKYFLLTNTPQLRHVNVRRPLAELHPRE